MAVPAGATTHQPVHAADQLAATAQHHHHRSMPPLAVIATSSRCFSAHSRARYHAPQPVSWPPCRPTVACATTRCGHRCSLATTVTMPPPSLPKSVAHHRPSTFSTLSLLPMFARPSHPPCCCYRRSSSSVLAHHPLLFRAINQHKMAIFFFHEMPSPMSRCRSPARRPHNAVTPCRSCSPLRTLLCRHHLLLPWPSPANSPTPAASSACPCVTIPNAHAHAHVHADGDRLHRRHHRTAALSSPSSLPVTGRCPASSARPLRRVPTAKHPAMLAGAAHHHLHPPHG